MRRKFGAILLTALILLTLCGCGRKEAKDLFTEGSALLENGQTEEALAVFESLAETGQFTAEAYRAMGLCDLELMNYPDACVAFERARNNTDGQDAAFIRDVDLYLALARTLHSENDKAIDIYTEMLRSEADPMVYYLRGSLYMTEGMTEEASEDFHNAAEMNPDYSLYISIYQIYADADKDADGTEFLKMALDRAEADEDAYYDRGLVYFYLQNYNEAGNQLLKALEKDPDDSQAMLLLGRVYLTQGDTANARALFRGHTEDDSAGAAYNGLALCDIGEGNYESAMENVTKGLEYADDSSRQALLFNEIVILENQAEWSEARQKASAYVVAYPTDTKGIRENQFLQDR